MNKFHLAKIFFSAFCTIASASALAFACDGVTDDAPAINAALAAGGEVKLPAGTCMIGTTLNIPNIVGGVSKTSLRGAGFYATSIQVLPAFSSPVMILVNGATTVTDLELDGQGKTIWGIKNVTATGNIPSIFRSLAFVSLANGGYVNDGLGAVYNISDSFFNSTNLAIYNADWGTSSIISHNNVLGGQGFRITNSGHSNEGLVIDGNQIISSGGSGTMTFFQCLNCIISNNVIDGSSGVPSLNIAGGSLYKVTNNWIGKGSIISAGSEFYFNGNTIPNGESVVFNTVSNIQFSNNLFQCSLGCSSGQSLFLLASTNAQIHHNIFEHQKGAMYESGGSHILVEGNIFSGTCVVGAATYVFNRGGTSCNNASSYPTSW